MTILGLLALACQTCRLDDLCGPAFSGSHQEKIQQRFENVGDVHVALHPAAAPVHAIHLCYDSRVTVITVTVVIVVFVQFHQDYCEKPVHYYCDPK